jgi:hypothetical protein
MAITVLAFLVNRQCLTDVSVHQSDSFSSVTFLQKINCATYTTVIIFCSDFFRK